MVMSRDMRGSTGGGGGGLVCSDVSLIAEQNRPLVRSCRLRVPQFPPDEICLATGHVDIDMDS